MRVAERKNEAKVGSMSGTTTKKSESTNAPRQALAAQVLLISFCIVPRKKRRMKRKELPFRQAMSVVRH